MLTTILRLGYANPCICPCSPRLLHIKGSKISSELESTLLHMELAHYSSLQWYWVPHLGVAS